MSLKGAGKPVSNGDLAIGGGSILALVAALQPWHTRSLPDDVVSSDNAACGSGTVFQASHKGASRHALAR
jgi:hypothetical protein